MGGLLIGIDRDPAALEAAQRRLQKGPGRFVLVHSNYTELDKVLAAHQIDGVDGFLFDLGVSSHQLDMKDRGFSYHQDAALDMRMNPQASLSAYDVVNGYSERELARIIGEYGEERWAKRIAEFIVARRQTGPHHHDWATGGHYQGSGSCICQAAGASSGSPHLSSH